MFATAKRITTALSGLEKMSHQDSSQGRPHKDGKVDAALWIRPCVQLRNARFGKWYALSPPATPLLRPAR